MSVSDVQTTTFDPTEDFVPVADVANCCPAAAWASARSASRACSATPGC